MNSTLFTFCFSLTVYSGKSTICHLLILLLANVSSSQVESEEEDVFVVEDILPRKFVYALKTGANILGARILNVICISLSTLKGMATYRLD